MSERFAKKWESRREEGSFVDTIRGTVKPQAPLKPRLDYAVKRLELQMNRLDQANDRFTQKDKTLFAKLVDAYTKHDTAHANIYANELGRNSQNGQTYDECKARTGSNRPKNQDS